MAPASAYQIAMPTGGDIQHFRRYDRFALTRGLYGWVYDYWHPWPFHHVGIASGLDIGVQLAGDWTQRGERSEPRVYGPGTILRLSAAERYAASCCSGGSRSRPSTQVGFTIYPQQLERYRSLDEEIVFEGDAGQTDARFHEHCKDLAAARRRGQRVSEAETRKEVLAFVERHATLVPITGLVAAKREIERHYEAELYVEHIAEVAGLHPAVFTRAFKSRFGVTPVHYRLDCRLNEAAELVWSRHDLSIEEIAERSGFHDMPYFHRMFRRSFGTTPAKYGGRAIAHFEAA